MKNAAYSLWIIEIECLLRGGGVFCLREKKPNMSQYDSIARRVMGNNDSQSCVILKQYFIIWLR